MHAAGSLQRILKFFFPLQFSTASSPSYTILWMFAEEYVLGGGVDEAAGVNVRRLGKGEPHISTHLIAKGQSLSTDIMPRSPTFTLPAFFFSKNMEE
jgi:hypothetical protein